MAYKSINTLSSEEKEKRRAENRMKSKKYGQKYRDFKSMWQLKANMKKRKEMDKESAKIIIEEVKKIIRRNK